MFDRRAQTILRPVLNATARGLVRAGISRVVASLQDPNPLVAGQGFARLRAAGIGVEVGPGAQAAAPASLPAQLADGVFVGEHGSWNRKPHSGYKVVFVPFEAGQPKGLPVDVLTGFLSPEGKAYGRPVGVAMDARGALLVADDVGNVIWRVSARPAAAR